MDASRKKTRCSHLGFGVDVGRRQEQNGKYAAHL